MPRQNSYYVFGGLLNEEAFSLHLAFDEIDDDGRLAFTEKDTGEKYFLNSKQIREFHQDNLMCQQSLIQTNQTPLVDAGQSISDAITGGDISLDEDSQSEIMDAAEILFRTELRRLRSA